MQIETERTLRNINVISSVRQNDKLLTQQDIFIVYEPTSLRGLLRMLYYRENREQNVTKIQCTIREAKRYVESVLSCTKSHTRTEESFSTVLQQTTQTQTCCRMIEALSNCDKGLHNMEETYRDDSSISVKIKMLRDEIKDFLNATREYSPLFNCTSAPEIPTISLSQ